MKIMKHVKIGSSWYRDLICKKIGFEQFQYWVVCLILLFGCLNYYIIAFEIDFPCPNKASKSLLESGPSPLDKQKKVQKL